jgi:acetyltransferase-like isoleucine patch superfamily enzyme
VSARLLDHDWYPETLPENVALGDGTWLYSSFAFMHFRSRRPMAVRTGRSCGIYNGCFFDLGESGEIAIGDFSTLVGVIVCTNGRVRIGSYCFLAHEIVIADRHAPTLGGFSESDFDSVILGDDVWIGAGAVLLKGARIGDGAIVGAASVVDFEVPENAVVAGNPARIVGFAQ